MSRRYNGLATSSAVARAEQQGQSFSQLKVGDQPKNEQTEMVFDPQQQASLQLLTSKRLSVATYCLATETNAHSSTTSALVICTVSS